MKFRTEVEVSPSSWDINHSMRGLAIGSCFTTYIGGLLAAAKFPLMQNPLGTVYNPISIKNTLDVLFKHRTILEQELEQNAGVWSSFYLHGDFSSPQKEQVISSCQNRIAEFQKNYMPLNYILISLGTSWVYEHKNTQQIVSNCHKFPAKNFTRKRLSVAEAEQALQSIIQTIHSAFPLCNIVFTVSPIRHWKDGALENQVSKSVLFVALDSILSEEKVFYFPAYEMLMDDLRDYRFYAEDMLHPNNIAVSYIYEQFKKTYFSKETDVCVKMIQEVHKAMNHRPYHKESEEYRKFLETYKNKTKRLAQEYTHINFTKELDFFSR